MDAASRDGFADYAHVSAIDLWTNHPVYGGPSWDMFVHSPHNPVMRGSKPYEWPVNGSLFIDPVSGNWYLYVGEYVRGYIGAFPSRCHLFRSTDRGDSWTDMGVVLEGDPDWCGGDGVIGGHTPEGTVVYDGGKYHFVFDWGDGVLGECGLAYAVADRPEGPFRIAAEPLIRRSAVTPLEGVYSRPYAGALIKRETDWLVLGMFDDAPNSWALFGMTAATPDGPYSGPVLLRRVQADYFHPPLLEFFPPFSFEGYVYAPATSVAMSRDFNCLFRAPLESAHQESAWEMVRHGSVWHSEPVEHESGGIWGQTFSGVVDENRKLQVMFPTLDGSDTGAINLAVREWDAPLSESGFVMTATKSRSLTLLRRGWGAFTLEADLEVRGTAKIVWYYNMPLGPLAPESNTHLELEVSETYQALELTEDEWRVTTTGNIAVDPAGIRSTGGACSVRIEMKTAGFLTVAIDGVDVLTDWVVPTCGRLIGLMLEPGAFVRVDRFAVKDVWTLDGEIDYLALDGLLGAGQSTQAWTKIESPEFRFGVGYVSSDPRRRVKWNVYGTGFRIWSPKAPGWGAAQVIVDGAAVGEIDFSSPTPLESSVVFSHDGMGDGPHAIVLKPIRGVLVADCLVAVTAVSRS